MKKLVLTSLVVTTLFGCASNPQKALEKEQKKEAKATASELQDAGVDVPAWFIKPPAATDEYLYVAGAGVSSDIVMSRDKAILNAQDLLADTLNARVDSATRSRKVDNGGSVSEDYTSKSIRKSVKETFLTGMQIEHSRITREGRGYRTYILVKYPIGDTNRLLREKLNREDNKVNQDDKIDAEVDGKKVSEVMVPPATVLRPLPTNTVKEVVLADYTKSANAEEAKLKALEAATARARATGGQVVQLSTTVQ
jgi:hypothetical protein